MAAFFMFLAAAQLSPAILDAYENITPQVASRRVAACGAGAVVIRTDAVLDVDILVVTAAAVSDAQLICVEKAASFYPVEFPPSVQPRFDAVREARSTALMAAEGRKWLKDHGLLDRLPTYRPGVTDDEMFRREVEQLCGTQEARRSTDGPHAIDREWPRQRGTDAWSGDESMACLLNVTWAAGFKLGFIGREQDEVPRK